MECKILAYLVYDKKQEKYVFGSFSVSDVFDYYFNHDRKRGFTLYKSTICKNSFLLFMKANIKENQTKNDWFWIKEYFNHFNSIAVTKIKVPEKDPKQFELFDSFKGNM